MKIFQLLAMIGVSFSASAQPPQIAIEVCMHQSSGSRCSFSAPHGKISGTCLRPPAEQRLICVPEGIMHNRPPARQGRRPPTRRHVITQSDGSIDTIRANTRARSENRITMSIDGKHRILIANGIPEHLTGQFPNAGNPNAIQSQRYVFRITAHPKVAAYPTSLGLHSFGLGINGVPFDPRAAEWYLGDRQSGWQYEAMSGAIHLGLDDNYAHVQPTGAYHYHGLPSLLLSKLALSSTAHSPLVGWAADGFPIYALYGYTAPNDERSGIIENTSSYRLKNGQRPSGGRNPGGRHDGTFVADHEYVPGAGSLDECNGRLTRTPEFPDGTYAYFLTRSFPIIPRCYKGTPSTDFISQRSR